MIASMKKAALVFEKEKLADVLEALQNCGEMMFSQPYTPQEDNSEEQQTAGKCLQLIKRLKSYQNSAKSKNLPEVDTDSFNKFDTSNLESLNKISAIFETIDARQKDISEYNNLLSGLERWEKLPLPLDMLTDTAYTSTLVGYSDSSRFNAFLSEISKLDVSVDTAYNDKTRTYFSVTFLKEDSNKVEDLLSQAGFVEEKLPPMSGTTAENIAAIKATILQAQSAIDEANADLTRNYSSYMSYLSILYEKCNAKATIRTVPFDEKDGKIHINGWVRADRVVKLENAIKTVTSSYTLSLREPSENDNPPTAISNNRFVSQFEGITNMFSVPSAGELDPNPFMAWWYWLIFGMMMGDAGYGVLLAAAIFIGKKILKPKGETLRLMNVFQFSSITTIVFGVLFGSYFGETINPIFISPVEQPINMLIFTLIVGVAHIFTGLFVGMLEDIHHKHFWDAVFDRLSWIVLISGVGMLFLESTRRAGAVAAIIGAAVIFLTAGRKKKGLFGKIAGGFAGLYGATGYLSDILSYSRIFALGLATGIIGMVVNMLAGLVQGSVIGFIFSVGIYIVGHIVNLALGLLSSYVHDCRLQYIEFYGKFYEGGGTLFKPFAHNLQYIKLK